MQKLTINKQYKSITSRLHSVRKSDEDFEDLDEDVYCSIAVTKHM